MTAQTRAEKVLSWTRPCLRDLKPYYKAPLDGDPLRLDQNTNLWGANPALGRVDAARIDPTQYPTRDSDGLLDALATTHGIPEDRFVIGNGSDEVLDIITKTFTQPGQTLACPWPAYSLYPFYARLQDLEFKQVPLRGGWRLDVDALLATQAAVTLLATPNNPTGQCFPTADLERLLTESDGIVVLDEAYIEYAPDRSFLGRVDQHDNLIVMRTFSKAYGLAGLRIGYMAANADLAERLRLVKPPFNLNLYSEAVAIEALRDPKWMHGVVADTVAERDRMADMLGAAGFRVFPGDANFLLTESTLDPGHVAAGLRTRGILVRTFPGSAGLERCVRFTVGRPEHTDALRAALEDMA